jgi:hypothetical protein
VGEGGEKTPLGAVFQDPEKPPGTAAQDSGAPMLPEINQTAAVLGVKAEFPGPEYGWDKA